MLKTNKDTVFFTKHKYPYRNLDILMCYVSFYNFILSEIQIKFLMKNIQHCNEVGLDGG